jgi:hypothetical protein
MAGLGMVAAWQGKARRRWARHGRRSKACPGAARLCTVSYGKAGMAVPGMARPGGAALGGA